MYALGLGAACIRRVAHLISCAFSREVEVSTVSLRGQGFTIWHWHVIQLSYMNAPVCACACT